MWLVLVLLLVAHVLCSYQGHSCVSPSVLRIVAMLRIVSVLVCICVYYAYHKRDISGRSPPYPTQRCTNPCDTII